ncbi:unnamed protein product [Symbiodinium microadriaticum]|nr:unnamed protein product [Symbiodinium microadriaticum]
MHLVHLAVVPDVLCSLLLDLSDGAARREDELNNLYNSYHSWCEEAGVPDRASKRLFSSATLHPGSRDYVAISQKLLSAHAARYAVFWMAQLMTTLLGQNRGSEFFAIRAGVVIALARIESICLQSGRFLSDQATLDVRTAYLVYRSGHNRLCEAALSANLCRWQLRPKGHYIEHMIYDTVPLNPRFLHNYLSEDFIRRIKLMAVKAHPAHLSGHVLFKYALQATLRWRE